MQIQDRIVRSLKELLNLKQWPKRPQVKITNQDELYLSQLVRLGDVVFDIGANHGSLARFIASLCGIKGKVVAFEPVWRVYERMCERLQAESLLQAPIITVPLGISDQVEIVEIHFPEGEWGDCLASIAPVEQVRKAHNTTDIRSLKCGVITLDIFVQTSGLPQPNLVKVDVEGAECKVLAGGRSVFEHEKQPLVFIELVGPWLRKFGDSLWDALGYLQSVGYKHLFMCPEGLIEYQATKEKPIPSEFRMGYNVISYIPCRHQWARDNLEPYLASKKPSLPPMDPPSLPNE